MNNKVFDLIQTESRPPAGSALGKVVGVSGPIVLATLPGAGIGNAALIKTASGREVLAEIAGFRESNVQLAPIDDIYGIAYGDEVESKNAPLLVSVPKECRGMLLNSAGQPIESQKKYPSSSICVSNASPSPISRIPVSDEMLTGVAAIDTFTPIAKGQRVVIKAPAGVGKTTLVSFLARQARVDVCVVGLVGERGREVGEFYHQTLSSSARERTVVVASTSDEPPAKRKLAACVATSIAEQYREQGLSVLLIIDSLTRYARAIRELGLSLGELPVRHGYTPSVYTELPKLLERAGNSSRGSITAFYTLLTASDEEMDPLAEEVTSIVDGHLTLSSKLFQQGYRPAIDITRSLSRCKDRISNAQDERVRGLGVQYLAKLYRERDLLIFGGQADRELTIAFEVEKCLKSHFLANSCRETILAEMEEHLEVMNG